MPTTLHANNAFASAEENCDPSYPDVCVAPPPPDLNCTTYTVISQRNVIIVIITILLIDLLWSQ
jgi:hypothetical protein